MTAPGLEARLRDSELSRLRAWEQLQRLRAVLEVLSGRRLPEPEARGFEAEGDALVGALYEEVSASLEDLGRLEAFFGQLQPVIGRPLPEEEAEGLRRSMLGHLPQRPAVGRRALAARPGVAQRGVTAGNKTTPVRFGACAGHRPRTEVSLILRTRLH